MRQTYRDHAESSEKQFAHAGLPVMPSMSRVVPVLVGDPVHTKLVYDLLLQDLGVYVQPINCRSVLRGTEHLRFTPTSFR